MNVALVGPPTAGYAGSTFPPLTLVHLATILYSYKEQREVFVRVIDLQLAFAVGELSMDLRDIHSQIASLIAPECFDLLLIPTMCNNLPFVVGIAEECKRRNPSLTIVIGGMHATLVARELVQAFPSIDIVVRGEGEQTLVKLLDVLADGGSLSTVDGLTFQARGRVVETPERAVLDNLDILPIPNFSLLESITRYQPERGWGDYAMFIDVGRGCPFQCTFCPASLFWQRHFRQKSAPRIVQEMDRLYHDYGIGHFYFNQDDFTVSRNRLTAFCNELIDRKRNYDWKIYARLADLDEPTIKLIVTAGCGGVFCGIESACSQRQTEIRKNVPLDKVLPRIRQICRYGLECITSLIIGFPDETEEETNQTLSLGLQLAEAGASVRLNLLTPHPQTALWKQHEASLCIYSKYYPYYDDSEFLTPHEHDLIGRYPRIFSVFANYATSCQPFSKVFNIYYDYMRCINRFAAPIRSALEARRTTMVGLHNRWRGFMADACGKGWDEVVGNELLDMQFPAFLESVL